ncbi:hypothetical protein ABVK25_007788 [Lepraria finkii]|uniref:Uncharacterized protein n=1 Tax=Lepraria finkii TaxID=1340010 RepID=A0ABR4B3A2_9LECA
MAPSSKARASKSNGTTPSDTSMTDYNDRLNGRKAAETDNDSIMFNQDTPDYSDSDTNPNTTATSDAEGVVQPDGRKRRIEATNLRKNIFGKKHSRLDESKEDDTIRRFRYLLGLTDLFRHFIDASPNPRIKEILATIDRQNDEDAQKAKKGHARAGGAAGERRRRTEQEGGRRAFEGRKAGWTGRDCIP